MATADHSNLLAAIKARYPAVSFNLIARRGGYSWRPGLIDRDGNRVTDNLAAWIDQELLAAGNDAREVWRRHKDAGLVKTEWKGEKVYITVPFGKDPDAFQQIEILAGSIHSLNAIQKCCCGGTAECTVFDRKMV